MLIIGQGMIAQNCILSIKHETEVVYTQMNL